MVFLHDEGHTKKASEHHHSEYSVSCLNTVLSGMLDFFFSPHTEMSPKPFFCFQQRSSNSLTCKLSLFWSVFVWVWGFHFPHFTKLRSSLMAKINCQFDVVAVSLSVLLGPSATAPPALNTRRSSNFCLVGSHKITLASLGHSKFPLDKVTVCLDISGKSCSHCFWHP